MSSSSICGALPGFTGDLRLQPGRKVSPFDFVRSLIPSFLAPTLMVVGPQALPGEWTLFAGLAALLAGYGSFILARRRHPAAAEDAAAVVAPVRLDPFDVAALMSETAPIAPDAAEQRNAEDRPSGIARHCASAGPADARRA